MLSAAGLRFDPQNTHWGVDAMPTGLGDEKFWLCPTLDDSADDLSGNGNHGTYNNSMTTTASTGSGGTKAYNFDDNADTITGTNFPLSTTSGFGFSCWFNLDAFNTSGGKEFYLLNSGVKVMIRHSMFPNPQEAIQIDQQRTGTTSTYQTSHQSLSGIEGTWVHLAVNIESGWNTDPSKVPEVFLNGSSLGSISSSGAGNFTGSSSTWTIGTDDTSQTHLVDDIRYFDRVLGLSEITHLASARGVQGSPYTSTGIGDEKLWLCPSLDDSPDDLSGNNHHGTYNGGMGTVADTNVGGTKAYSFDGTDDFINCGSSIDTTAPLSVSCWFNSDQVRNFQGLVSRSAGSSFPNFIFYTHGSSEVGTYIGAHRRTSSLVATGYWYHTCFTLDANGNLNLYFNGSLVRSDTSVSMSYSAAFDLLIGDFQSATGSDYPHDGLMDDIRIFGRVLSETEIDHLGTSRGIEGNPYQFNGLGDEKLWLCPSLNDSADDLSGNGNHGTYNGGMGTVLDDSGGGVKAYSFDGIDDRIALPSSTVNPLFCGTNTVAMWMRIEGNTFTADGDTTLVGHDSTATTWYNFTYVNNGGLRSFADNGSANGRADASSAQAGGTFEDDVWRHVVCIRDYANQQVRFYVDGTEVASVSSTVTAPSSISDNPFVGYSSLYGYASGYNGGVYIRYDDIRIFDRALTTTEITALASKRGYRNLTGPHPHPLTVSIEHPLG